MDKRLTKEDTMSPSPSVGIGPYRLGAMVVSLSDGSVQPFSDQNYERMAAVGVERVFPNELLYWGNQDNFLGSVWEPTVVAAIDGRVYKISCQNTMGGKAFRKRMLGYLVEQLGCEYENQGDGLLLWNGDYGNVVLHFLGRTTTLTFTSSLVRSTERGAAVNAGALTDDRAHGIARSIMPLVWAGLLFIAIGLGAALFGR